MIDLSKPPRDRILQPLGGAEGSDQTGADGPAIPKTSLGMAKIFRFGGNRQGSRGFTLVETLAALAVAAIFMAVLTRGFISARASSDLGETTLRGIVLARTLAMEWRENQLTDLTGTRAGFHYRIETRPVQVQTRPSAFPPAPMPSQDQNAAANNAQQPGAAQKPGEDKGPPPVIARVEARIHLTTPSGHVLNYATAKLAFIRPSQEQE